MIIYYDCLWFELKLYRAGHKILKQKKNKHHMEVLLASFLSLVCEWIHNEYTTMVINYIMHDTVTVQIT